MAALGQSRLPVLAVVTPDELEAEIQRRLLEAGQQASETFARFWWSEAQKLEEMVPDPASRWEIMVKALRLIGWGDTGRE